MLELKFVASIAERDVDFLLMEELSVSSEFRQWLSSRVFGEPVYQKEIGAWHSVSDSILGESDIVFLFEALDGPRTAILIENKIDAPPQQKQAERYRLRGEKGLKDGHWENYVTCVIAPQKYLVSANKSQTYDMELSYEEILAYFQSRSSRHARFAYRAKILLEAIEKNRRGYQAEHNDEMTKYVFDYISMASKDYAHLGVQEAAARPAGNTWIGFHPESLPKGIFMVHQMKSGFVKVFFDKRAEFFDLLEAKYSTNLPDNASIEITGKSVAISVVVPKLEPLSLLFSEQEEKVKQALNELSQLEKIVSKHGGI